MLDMTTLQKNKIFLYVLICLPLLTGCASKAEQAKWRADEENRKHSACTSMGFKKGTALYLQCRQSNELIETQQRRQADIRRNKVFNDLHCTFNTPQCRR